MLGLFEKCADCHLFVTYDLNGEYEHAHRDDDADNRLDASHPARPSGLIATLEVWRAYGPEEMRARFLPYYMMISLVHPKGE